MAQLVPIFLAFLTTFTGHLFPPYTGRHITGCHTCYSLVMIRLSIFFLLLNSPLYLRQLRKIHSIPNNMFQYIFGLFILENVVNYIWYPLENFWLCVSLKLYSILCNTVPIFSECSTCVIGMDNKYLQLISYVLSTLILFTVLHATRCVDFRLIR